MKGNTWFSFGLVSAALLTSACSDDPSKRPLGGVCGGDDECVSGLCLSGQCLDPEADEDGDGLVNRIEAGLGSNPFNPDSDYDGVADGDELDNFVSRDTDGDSVADILESQLVDADSDCLPDEFDPDNGTQASDLSSAVSALCSRNGVCRQAIGNVHLICDEQKRPVCVYSDVPGYEAEEASCDGLDNDCDGHADEGFRDSDGDGTADCADDDLDGDGEVQTNDNCPAIENADQADADADDIGDVCDPPSAPKIGTLASPTGDTTPTVSGTGEALSIVRVFADATCSTKLGEGAASSAGAYAFDVTLSGEGLHLLYLQAENPAGLLSACVAGGSIELDLTDPVAASNVTARALTWDESGATFEIVGRGEAGGRVAIFADGTCGGTPVVTGVVVSDIGDFSAVADFVNSVGAIGVTITDVAGNDSPCLTGPVLFGNITVIATRFDKPATEFPVQFHYPDGAAMKLVLTDGEGIATTTIFAGCAVTAQIDGTEGYGRWFTVWGVVPGQTIELPLPERTIIGETPLAYAEYSWSDAPEGTNYYYLYTPCGSQYVYTDGQNYYSSSYSPGCLGSSFDSVLIAYGDPGMLGYTVVRDTVASTNGDQPSDVTFGAFSTSETKYEVKFEHLPPASALEAMWSPYLNELRLPQGYTSGYGGGTQTMTTMLMAITGLQTDILASVRHLGAYGEGVRGQFIEDAPPTTVIDAGLLPPRVVDSSLDYDNTAGRYLGLHWVAEAGLAAAVDAGVFDTYFYGQNGSLDWQFLFSPRDDAELLFPTFDEGFPNTYLLDGIYYGSGGNVTWFDFPDRDGFVDALDQCENGAQNCFHLRDGARFTSCCDSNRGD